MSETQTKLQLLTPDDIAHLMQLSKQTVMEMAQRGDIPAPTVDLPRVKRWHPDIIDRWLKTGRKR